MVLIKVSKFQKQIMTSKVLQKNQTKLTILSTEGAQDSEFCSFFGRSYDVITCFSKFTDLYS